MNVAPLIDRIQPIALNIVRVTLEDGTKVTVQELYNHLTIIPYPSTA